MQLLIILALLLYGGKSGAQDLLTEVKPVLESIGGDEMREALKSAEEISNVLNAVNGLTGSDGGGLGGLNNLFGGNQTYGQPDNRTAAGNTADNAAQATANSASAQNKNAAPAQSGAGAATIAFPLKPIGNIADRDITYSLSRYITEN